MTVTVKGLDRLKRQLASLPGAQKAAAAAVLATNARDLAARIAAAAPRADPVRLGTKGGRHSGDLAAGIKAVPVGGSETSAGVKAEAGLAWKISAQAPARWVEFGTAGREGDYATEGSGHARHAGPGGHHATRPRPFFWPTVRAWKKPMKAKVVAASRKAAKAVAAGL